MARASALVLVGLCLQSAPAAGVPSDSASLRRVHFATDEGTWMSLDVAPDMRSIVFELVGDLYSLPMTGGKAQRLTGGAAFDAQPRYSPDGRSIVFVSDRSGADNIWIMDVQSGALRPLTQEQGTYFISPEWVPDGEYIVVSRSTVTAGFSREYQLFLYPSGGGMGRQLTSPASAQQPEKTPAPPAILGATFGADPQRIFAAIQVKPKWPSFGEWQIASIDCSSGAVEQYTDELNGAVRPVLSPNGRYLVYATRWERQTRLKLVDLKSREERWLASEVDRDAEDETAPRRDLLPGAAFSADSNALLVAHHGKIWRVSVPDGGVSPVPFNVDVDVRLSPLARFDYPIDERNVTVRRIEQPQLSPDGRWLAFSAHDRIWVQSVRLGERRSARAAAPRQVSRGSDGAFFPAWSPDGRHLAYVTWNDLEGGGIWRVRPQGNAKPERLSVGHDFYEKLAYSPDGQRLVAARAPLQERFDFYNENLGIGRGNSREWVWFPANGGEPSVITNINPVTYWGASSHYGRPHFVKGDVTRLYFTDRLDGLVSVRWDGSQRQSILRVEGPGFGKQELADEMLLSPDAKQVIALLNNQIWLLDRPARSGPLPTVVLPSDSPALPARRLSHEGGDFPQWSADGRHVLWSLGSTLFTHSSGGVTKKEPQRHDVVLRVAREIARGVAVLRGARIITMRADEVIENADLVITGNRISAVGRQGTVNIPAGARILNVSGKTILPGYVDVHWHGAPPWGVHRRQVWEFQANLAYGVTSIRDPQPASMDALTYADRIASGEVLGPRHFTTGRGVFESDGIQSLQDARAVARRYAQFYRTETLKDYMIYADRQVHQWMVSAAREYHLTATAEGNSDFKYSLTRIFDGYGGQEHMSTTATYYQDLTQLVAASGTTITPTVLEGQAGGQDRLKRFVYEHDLYRDAKVKRFFPPKEIEYLSVGAAKGTLENAYTSQELAAQPIALLAAGGRIALGVHGAIHGLGAHWVLWTFVEGGMRAHDALRVATLFGAQAIGHGRNFGSIEPEKLADLQVLDGNPLDDIRQTLSLRYVMINGRIYEAETLKQIWPVSKPLGPQWWQSQAPTR